MTRRSARRAKPNVNKAKELLAKSGIKTPVSFTIYVGQGDNIGKEIATAAAGAWAAAGRQREGPGRLAVGVPGSRLHQPRRRDGVPRRSSGRGPRLPLGL